MAWFRTHAIPYLFRNSPDPYTVWVLEIMAQQTQLGRAVTRLEQWLQRFPAVASLAAADEAQVLKAWEGLGYYSRARNLHRAARIIMDEHQGRFPDSYRSLLALPGVGPYTAAAIASIVYGEAMPAVDANVRRVFARLLAWDGDGGTGSPQQCARSHGDGGNTTGQRAGDGGKSAGVVHGDGGPTTLQQRIEQEMQAMFQWEAPGLVNEGLMELGERICRQRGPLCPECPLREMCRAYHEGITDRIPRIAAGRSVVRQDWAAALILDPWQRVLAYQDPEASLWRGLWQLPRVLLPGGTEEGRKAALTENQAQAALQDLAHMLGAELELCSIFLPFSHSYTRYRLRFYPLLCRWLGTEEALPDPGYRWLDCHSLHESPFPSAYLKLLARVLPEGRLDQTRLP